MHNPLAVRKDGVTVRMIVLNAIIVKVCLALAYVCGNMFACMHTM